MEFKQFQSEHEKNVYARGWWLGRDGKNPGPTQQKMPVLMDGWNDGLAERYKKFTLIALKVLGKE